MVKRVSITLRAAIAAKRDARRITASASKLVCPVPRYAPATAVRMGKESMVIITIISTHFSGQWSIAIIIIMEHQYPQLKEVD